MKISKLFSLYVVLGLGLAPLLFNPWLVDAFEMGKLTLVLLLGAGGLGLWAVSMLLDRQEKVVLSKWFIGWVLLVLIGLVGWWQQSAGIKARSWSFGWGLGSEVAVLVWLFLALQVRGEKMMERLVGLWSVVGGVMSVLNLILFLVPVKKLPWVLTLSNPILSIGINFSSLGAVVAEVIFLGILLGYVANRVWDKYKRGDNYIGQSLLLAVLVVGMVMGASRLMKIGLNLMDFNSAWIIATETMKNRPLWGMGTGNYVEAFYKYRPNSFNLTGAWSAIFGLAPMAWMQIWTEMGILGLMVLLVFVIRILGIVKNWKKDWFKLILALVLVLAPLNLSLVLVVMVLLTLTDKDKKLEKTAILRAGEAGFNIMPVVLAVVGLVAAGGLVFVTYKPIKAGLIYRDSMALTAKNDGVGTYNKQVLLIGTQPNMGDYRLTYSQTNLALAQALLSSVKNGDLTTEQKQQVSTLLGQAVAEAKTAVALEPANPNYWANLGNIYRTMVGVVDNAFDFSLQSYNQAVALEPANVINRITLGGLYYAVGNFEAADRVFEEAVKSKPNFANSWYNWAHTNYQMSRQNAANVNFRGQKLANAVQYLQQALTLVPADSGDFDKASKELTAWKEELTDLARKQQELLRAVPTPKPAETLNVPEKIDNNKVGKEERVDVEKDKLEPPKP